jgi:hypothetical protein
MLEPGSMKIASMRLARISRRAFSILALRSSSEIGTTPSVIRFSFLIGSGVPRCCCGSTLPARAVVLVRSVAPATPAESRKKSLLSVHMLDYVSRLDGFKQGAAEIYHNRETEARIFVFVRVTSWLAF